MRKRERAAIVRELQPVLEDFQRLVSGQLGGSIWYFDNNSEIKGWNFAYAAASQAIAIGTALKLRLDKRTKLLDKRRRTCHRTRRRDSPYSSTWTATPDECAGMGFGLFATLQEAEDRAAGLSDMRGVPGMYRAFQLVGAP